MNRSSFELFQDLIEEGSDLYQLKTEDGIKIRKLYFKLKDKTVKHDEIKFLLSVFGTIESIVLFGKEKNSSWKLRNRGFVTFALASEASCALINRKTFVELFDLSPADTWNQPDYQNMRERDAEESSIEVSSKLLDTLNDDCLLQVMKFLDILDVITLSKVCVKFLELCESHYKTIKSFNFCDIESKKKMTAHETKLIMESIGGYLGSITINSEKFYNQRALNFIPKYLTNLKQLHLTGFKLNSLSFWNQMSGVLLTLENLNLSDNSELNESFLKSFEKLSPKLKALNISNCTVNGKFLKLVDSIEVLNISGCQSISGAELLDYIEKNHNLKDLNISKCNLDGKDVNELLQKSTQLHVVTLSNYYIDDETSRLVIPNINPLINLKELSIQNVNYPLCDQLLRTIYFENRIEALNICYGNLTLTSIYAISTMRHLKKLVMNFKNVPEDIVDYLVKLNMLEEVHISGCSYISPANVLRLLVQPKMKFLDISRCYGFTNDFIVEVAKLLQANHKRLTIRVGQTDVDRSILTSISTIGKFLHLEWDTTKDDEHDYDIDEENSRQNNLNQAEYFSIDGKEKRSLCLKILIKAFLKTSSTSLPTLTNTILVWLLLSKKIFKLLKGLLSPRASRLTEHNRLTKLEVNSLSRSEQLETLFDSLYYFLKCF